MHNTINTNLLKGKWNELKGEVQKLWGKLTDDELEQVKGDAKSLGGLVQQKYGIQEEEFRDKVNGIINNFDPSVINRDKH